jgi:hypothetical protein
MGLKNLKSKVSKFFKKVPSKEEVVEVIEKSKQVKDKVGEKLHLKKKDDGSSTQSTYEQENYSVFKDPTIPWYRRWWMFAFLYPTVISFLLEWLRSSLSD